MTKCMSPTAGIAVGSIRPKLYVLLVQLETYCWSRPWLWASNGEIARRLGTTERSVQRGLEQLEDLGIIARIMTDRERPERLGIVLLKRTNPTRPYCRTSRQLQDLAWTIRDRWADIKHVTEEVNPVVLAGEPDLPKHGEGQNPQKPQETDGLARQKRRAQHDRNVALSTTEMSSERIKQNSQNEPAAEPPVLKVAGEPELTPDGAEAVETVRKAVAGCERPQAALGVVAVAEAAVRRGHDPGRVVEMARESLGKDNPGGWLRTAIDRRAADEGGLLKARPKAPPPPSTPTIKIDPEVAAFYAKAVATGKVGVGIGRRPAQAWRAS